MWAIENATPYKVGKTWGRRADGAHQWIVAVKAVFDIGQDGNLLLAEEQLEPLLAADYYGEPGQSSLRYEADLVSPKPTTDVLVNGTAYAPAGRPSTDFLIAIKVGAVQKILRVRGNRRWQNGAFGVQPSAPEPIVRIPIVYEHAYGGFDRSDPDPRRHRMDSRNPVGRGIAAPSSRRSGQPLPNFEYPNGALESAGPAGFGPIDSHWSPRRQSAGTYDETWRKNRSPLLPEDWTPISLLSSPADQRPKSHLRGGELVELINLTADGRLRFTLPKIWPVFTTRIDRRTEEHRGHLSSVVLEPDRPRVIMTWTTALACRNDVDYLEETVVSEKRYI